MEKDTLVSDKSYDTLWDECRELVNMAPKELDDWLDTEESKSVGADSGDSESKGHKSGRRIVGIKRKTKDVLTGEDYDHMAEMVGYIKRHCAQDGPDDDVETSN